MNYLIRTISIQIFWGFVIGTAILVASWLSGYRDVAQLSNILFISAFILLFFGSSWFRPEGIDLEPKYSMRSMSFDRPKLNTRLIESATDEVLIGLSKEEQSLSPSLKGFLILTKQFGIGLAMFFYSIIFHWILAGSP